jgi:hypothetical protein
MLRRSATVTYRYLLTTFIIISCIISLRQFKSIPSLEDEQILHHKSIIYNVSDPLVITNLINQFLNTKDYNERDQLWLLLVKSWSKSFEIYLNRTESICSCKSSFDFIHKYFNSYRKRLFLNNRDFQRNLTGFGLFFDYNLNEIRLKDHPLFQNVFFSPCTYFELIILIMKVQFILSELNIVYFIGANTLIGALRHHDIVPWYSIIEFNLPLNSKNKFLKNLKKEFQLVEKQVNNSYINKQQIGFVYKIFPENQNWPQIEIYFYKENLKSEIFSLHLRPFGPILLFNLPNPHAMISIQRLNICESLSWDHQLEKQTDQWRIPCEQLYSVYSFVQTRYKWRQGYCEEILKSKHIPYQTLSYFRYTCQENTTYRLR